MTYVLTLGRRIFFYRLTGLASVGLSNFIMPRKHTKHCNLLVVLTSRERKKEEEDFNCVLHYTVQRDLNKELCEGYISLQEGDNRERNGKLTASKGRNDLLKKFHQRERERERERES